MFLGKMPFPSVNVIYTTAFTMELPQENLDEQKKASNIGIGLVREDVLESSLRLP